MKKYVINTQTKYMKDGEEKTFWNKVGTIVDFEDKGMRLNLFMFPETRFYVFEDKPKEQGDNW